MMAKERVAKADSGATKPLSIWELSQLISKRLDELNECVEGLAMVLRSITRPQAVASEVGEAIKASRVEHSDIWESLNTIDLRIVWLCAEITRIKAELDL